MSLYCVLTNREKDVIRLGALGLSDKGIATELNLSTNTVRLYFAQLRGKIGSFERSTLPGMGLLLKLVSLADITREALKFLQDGTNSFGTDAGEIREGYEGAD